MLFIIAYLHIISEQKKGASQSTQIPTAIPKNHFLLLSLRFTKTGISVIMIKFICLGSGSSGNCYYLNAEGFGIVIDLGISFRTFKKHFRDYGLSIDEIRAQLITHDHTDHIKSAGVLSQEFHIPVYTSEAVHKGMTRNYFMNKKINQSEVRILQQGSPEYIGPFQITSFHVPHDSSDNNGYFIQYQDAAFCIITDAGTVTDEMTQYISRSNYLVIEANYDADMLENGPYPRYLKTRISSLKGHLSNNETAQNLARHLTPEIRHIWLCHLSEENNHPELARKTVESALIEAGAPLGNGLELEVLKRTVPSRLYEL